MTRKELANKIKVSVDTLGNWEKNKPELIRIINMGLHAEEIILENNRINNKLKQLLMELNTPKLQLPKSEMNISEILDNPIIFDPIRLRKICIFLGNTHVIDFRKTLMEALEKQGLNDSGTYKYIKEQKSKKNLLSEFSKFIREMGSKDKNLSEQGNTIVQTINQRFDMDFNEKDSDIIDHVVATYDYYSKLYGIEDETKEF